MHLRRAHGWSAPAIGRSSSTARSSPSRTRPADASSSASDSSDRRRSASWPQPFGLTLNGVKKHVGILEEVDLVVTAKVGRARTCQLGPTQLDEAANDRRLPTHLAAPARPVRHLRRKERRRTMSQDVRCRGVINPAPEEAFDDFTGEDGQKAFYSEQGWTVSRGAITTPAGFGP